MARSAWDELDDEQEKKCKKWKCPKFREKSVCVEEY